MIHRLALPGALLTLAVTLLLPGCTRTKTITVSIPEWEFGTFAVHLDHTVGGAPLMLNGTVYTGQDGAGNAYSVSTLRYFVSNVQLRATNGAVHGINGYHYRDAGIPATRDYVLAHVPAGTYDQLVFTFGLDEQWNVSGNAIQNDPNVGGMEWPMNWGGGWHYMILEGNYDPANGSPYRTHTGRRFIAGTDSVAYPHEFPVRLTFPAPITIGGEHWQASVRMELNQWYDAPDVDLAALFPNGAGNIMTDLVAQALLQYNGPGCFSVTQPVSP